MTLQTVTMRTMLFMVWTETVSYCAVCRENLCDPELHMLGLIPYCRGDATKQERKTGVFFGSFG